MKQEQNLTDPKLLLFLPHTNRRRETRVGRAISEEYKFTFLARLHRWSGQITGKPIHHLSSAPSCPFHSLAWLWRYKEQKELETTSIPTSPSLHSYLASFPLLLSLSFIPTLPPLHSTLSSPSLLPRLPFHLTK